MIVVEAVGITLSLKVFLPSVLFAVDADLTDPIAIAPDIIPLLLDNLRDAPSPLHQLEPRAFIQVH